MFIGPIRRSFELRSERHRILRKIRRVLEEAMLNRKHLREEFTQVN